VADALRDPLGADEILGVNIEDLDFAGRRCPVKAKGALTKAHRRGQAREDFILETVCWDAGTARLLPRLLKGRTCGPVLVYHRKPGPGKVVSLRDVFPDTASPGCRMGRPELCWMSTPPCAGRGLDGTCTSTAIPP
jgi:hypothetical protein